jgi:hypothetical protein
MAEWEAERCYRSTYYILHTVPVLVGTRVPRIARADRDLRPRIGIHADALAAYFVTGRDPDLILDEAIETLRNYGFPITGVAGHGNPLCNRDRAPGEITFANDEQFVECARPQEGEPDRTITRGNVELKLEAASVDRVRVGVRGVADRVADAVAVFRLGRPVGSRRLRADVRLFEVRLSGGRAPSQLQMLQHPDWWAQALPAGP